MACKMGLEEGEAFWEYGSSRKEGSSRECHRHMELKLGSVE